MNLLFMMVLLAGCGAADCGNESWKDEGGVTFDFAAISERRFDLSSLPTAAMPGNLIPSDEEAAPLPNNYQKWFECRCYNIENLPGSAPCRRSLKEYVKLSREGGVLKVRKDASFVDHLKALEPKRDNLYSTAEGTWQKYVKLAAGGGSYRLSYRYRMKHTVPQLRYGTSGLVIIHAYRLSADGKKLEHISRPACPALADVFDDWTPAYVDFDVPKEADVISIQLRHDGIGELWMKDVFLVRRDGGKVAKDRGVYIRLSPSQVLDDTFVFSANQPQQLTWEWRLDSEDAYNRDDSEFRLSLPAGFEYLGDKFADSSEVRRNADGSSVVVFKVKHPVFLPGKSLITWNKPSVLVKATGAVGTEGVLSMSAWRKGEKRGDSGPVKVSIMPEIRTESPARYLYAAMPGASITVSFRQAEACAEYARYLAAIGVRHLACEGGGWIDCANAEVYRREFRAAGGRRITPCWGGMANGYYIGDHRTTPESDLFVSELGAGDSWSGYARKGLCPQAVIEERAYFREKVLPGLEKVLRGCDGLRANWEPFMFVHRGCFCATCRGEFAKWAGLDAAALEKDWPKTVKPGGELKPKWTRFRSEQHAKLVDVIERYVKKFSGGDDSLGFIPAITWREMNSTWRTAHPSPESEPFDYASRITTIGTWGPYCCWDAAQPYHYRKRAPLIHYIATRDVREQTDRDYPEGKRPKLLGGTQGLQCGEWIPQPEWLEMALDSYFFNGFDGCQAYFFPEGLDARFSAAYARSAGRAAKFEKYVADGKRDDASAVLGPVAEYAVPCAYVTHYLPDYRDVSPLQHAVYDLGSEKAIAVFNFWEKGEAFFDLRVPGLGPGEWTLVDEKGVRYAGDPSRGVRLVVGAARTKVFLLRPVTAADSALPLVSEGEMRRHYESRRTALRREAEADRRYEESGTLQEKADTKAEI